MITKYISGYEPYTKYKALDSRLFRRTDAYQMWARSYYRRPAVCARKAKNRPDKKAEAERKRRAYYACKGILEPPPRRVTVKNAADVNAEVKPMVDPAVDVPPHTATAATTTREGTTAETAVFEGDGTPLSVFVEVDASAEPPVANATPEVITDMFENK